MHRTTLALVLLGISLAASAADIFTGVRFSDGRNRTSDDLGDQTLILVYFCGHCPNAAKFMRTQGKGIHDAIEAQKVPAHLVCITPDFTPEGLVYWTRDYGMEHALVGQDTLNRYKIGLDNILQRRTYRNGRESHIKHGDGPYDAALKDWFIKSPGEVGVFRFPVDGLTEEKSRTLWWMVERDQPQAMETLVAARRNKALKDDAEKIYGVVEASLLKRQETLLAAGATFATYEGLETLLAQAKPIALKPAGEKLKELGKDAAIKTELKARAIYQQCQELLIHPNPQKQQTGREGLETLAKKYGETSYGKKAGGG
jgi:hypothetical protein